MKKEFFGNSRPYKIRLFVAAIMFIIATGAFYFNFVPVSKMTELNLGPVILRLFADFSIFALSLFLIHIVFAFFFGRFYCSCICPFGILQDIIGFIFKRKTGKTKNYSILRYTFFFALLISIVSGTNYIFKFFDPYTNFGNIVSSIFDYKTFSVSAVVIFVLITIFVIYKNRIFCTTLCPVGTFLGLISKFGYYKLFIKDDICVSCGLCEKNCPTGAIDSKEKTIDNERCIRCLRCTAVCRGFGIKFEHKKEEVKFNIERRKFIISSATALVLGAVFIKGKEIIKAIEKGIKLRPILPPGAISPERFIDKCTNCNLCIQNCRGKILEKPNENYDTIHINYKKGSCEFNCKNCSDVCPTGAIKKMSLNEKRNLRIGLVKIEYTKCISCGLCAKMCPKGALKINVKEKRLLYYPQNCIGCGLCENTCSCGAIEIVSVKEQERL